MAPRRCAWSRRRRNLSGQIHLCDARLLKDEPLAALRYAGDHLNWEDGVIGHDHVKPNGTAWKKLERHLRHWTLVLVGPFGEPAQRRRVEQMRH